MNETIITFLLVSMINFFACLSINLFYFDKELIYMLIPSEILYFIAIFGTYVVKCKL